MKRKTKRHSGATQGHALLYGRSSKAIRIVNGEIVGKANKNYHYSKSDNGKKSETKKLAPKRHQISEDAKRKLDKLQDPLAMISRFTRAQKYEAANSTEEYEYGLSDW